MNNKRLMLILSVVMSLGRMSGQYVPPDFFGETYNKSIGFWSNDGQVIDTHGNSRPDVEFYSEGSTPRLFMQEDTLSFIYNPRQEWDTTDVDTLYRIDMFLKKHGKMGKPKSWLMKDNYKNFYMPYCGEEGVRQVMGYNRIIYENVYDSIDIHLYSGSVGQKIAFVIKPGGDPS